MYHDAGLWTLRARAVIQESAAPYKIALSVPMPLQLGTHILPAAAHLTVQLRWTLDAGSAGRWHFDSISNSVSITSEGCFSGGCHAAASQWQQRTSPVVANDWHLWQMRLWQSVQTTDARSRFMAGPPCRHSQQPHQLLRACHRRASSSELNLIYKSSTPH